MDKYEQTRSVLKKIDRFFERPNPAPHNAIFRLEKTSYNRRSFRHGIAPFTMKTDSLFYRLFQHWPQLAMDLLGMPYRGDSYRFVSEEIKQTGFRIDGLFKPIGDDPLQPLVFAEVQYQADAEFYGRFFTEITLYLYRQKPGRHWRAFVIYPSRQSEKPPPPEFEAFMALPQLQRIYLDTLQSTVPPTPEWAMIQLIASPPQRTVELARTLVAQRAPLNLDMLDFVETVLVYKLPHLSREEIRIMLALNDVELKKTRFYQEVAEEKREEGRQEGKQEGKREGKQEEGLALVKRLLRRRLGERSEIDDALPQLQNLPLESLEALAEALLDFTGPGDLTAWLAKTSENGLSL